MGGVNNLADKIEQWKIGGKKLGSDPIQIKNNNIFHTLTGFEKSQNRQILPKNNRNFFLKRTKQFRQK
jgi:hypothetical protein